VTDPDIAANRAHWNTKARDYQATHNPVIGRAPKLWGVHAIPDDQLGALGDVTGLDVLELGCGAAQWASSLATDGARVVGLDLSDEQLDVARATHPALPLVHAPAQALPFRDASFDVVFCDHGAMGWADPSRTLPDVARVLRAGGRLVFSVASPFVEMCWDENARGPATRLRQDYFGLGRTEERDGATYFVHTYGEWIRLLVGNGFAVDDLIEPRPTTAEPNTYWGSDPPDWFTRWPGECIWICRRVISPGTQEPQESGRRTAAEAR
jgi:SAM-dependent methyltransferase